MGDAVILSVEDVETEVFRYQYRAGENDWYGASTRAPAAGAWVEYWVGDHPERLTFLTGGQTNIAGAFFGELHVTRPTLLQVRVSYSGGSAVRNFTVKPPTGGPNPVPSEPNDVDSRDVTLEAGLPEADGEGTFKSQLTVRTGLNWELTGAFRVVENPAGAALSIEPALVTLPEDGGPHAEVYLKGITPAALTKGIVVEVVVSNENGKIGRAQARIALPVEFKAREGRINFGFDPPLDEGDDAPWASVVRGTSNDNVVFAARADLAPTLKLSITDGFDFLKIEPQDRPLSAAETILTLFGLEENLPVLTNAKVEALLVNGNNAVSPLSVTILPQRTVSIGIYRVTDSKSRFNTQVDGVTDASIMDTLNRVYQQAGIAFRLDGSGPRDADYDSGADKTVEDGDVEGGELTTIANKLASCALFYYETAVFHILDGQTAFES